MSTPLERRLVMPAQWGAKIDTTRPWADDPRYKPELTIVHYGGGANPAGAAPYSLEAECRMLRAWEAWHLTGKGMRALAYNYAIGQTGHIFYGRGPKHQNGGQYPPWNAKSKAVVFILGGSQVPSEKARRQFGRLWLEEPYSGEVLGHRDCGQTECPGDWLYAWVKRQGWIADLGVWSEGDSGEVVQSIKVRLHRLGYRPWPSFGPKFTAGTRRQVQRFQKRHGIQADGVVGPQTLRALGGLLGETFPDDHSDEPSDPAPSRWPPEVERWRPLVAKYFKTDDVELALGVVRCESVGDPKAISKKEWVGTPPPEYDGTPATRASGLFQHVPYWWAGRSRAAGWEGADIFDPEANVAVAAWLVYNSWDVPGAPHWRHWQTCYEWAKQQIGVT